MVERVKKGSELLDVISESLYSNRSPFKVNNKYKENVTRYDLRKHGERLSVRSMSIHYKGNIVISIGYSSCISSYVLE